LTEEALREAGFGPQADAVASIRKRPAWSHYAVRLLRNVQAAMRQHWDINKLRFLLYPANLTPQDRQLIEQDDAGVIWLGD
jgi:hypothetical protein